MTRRSLTPASCQPFADAWKTWAVCCWKASARSEGRGDVFFLVSGKPCVWNRHTEQFSFLPPPQQGFGNIDGEYWLGLENVYWLTNQGTYKLLVSLEDWTGRKTFAEYASFRVESEADFYRLRVGRYHGSAGDSLTWHNGKQFTTLDRDHDVYTGEWRAALEKAFGTAGGLSHVAV